MVAFCRQFVLTAAGILNNKVRQIAAGRFVFLCSALSQYIHYRALKR